MTAIIPSKLKKTEQKWKRQNVSCAASAQFLREFRRKYAKLLPGVDEFIREKHAESIRDNDI